jgi:glycosyltransferase involved in cell wall biosynthesis
MHSQYDRDFREKTKSEILTNLATRNVVHTFNSCNECWAVNTKIADIYRNFGVRKPIMVMNNATDLLPLPIEDDVELREKYGIAPGEPVFLFVGRIDRIKNIFFIVDALRHIKSQGMRFRMLFVGSGPQTKELQERIALAGLADNVVLVGRINDRVMLARHYRLADLFLFPSLYDASSLVQIEAASQRTPSVFLQGAATAATVTDRTNGFLAPDDPAAFADLVMSVMSDSLLYEKVSEGAFRDLYRSWDETVADVYRRYLTMVGSVDRRHAPRGSGSNNAI